MLLTSNTFFPLDRALRPESLHHSRGVAASGFPPLRKIPHCCLPQESGPCVSSSVADHPLRPANHRSLGRPLPYQQANGTRAHLQTVAYMQRPPLIFKTEVLKILSGISSPFGGLSPIRRQITHALLTRAPLYYLQQAKEFSYDLHVLSTPPAFILSQDQTLQLKYIICACLPAVAMN